MKTKAYLILAISGALAIQSCNSADRGDRDEETTILADSLSDTTTRAKALTADVDLTGDEKVFVLTAANSGMMEVEAANVILKKSKDAEVKALAQQVLTDHTKANKDLEAFAKGKGIALPTVLSDEHAKHVRDLAALVDRPLNTAYITMMIEHHKKSVTLFSQATQLKDFDLKSMASQTLPVLTGHLKKAEELGKKMNVSNQGNGDDLNAASPNEGTVR